MHRRLIERRDPNLRRQPLGVSLAHRGFCGQAQSRSDVSARGRSQAVTVNPVYLLQNRDRTEIGSVKSGTLVAPRTTLLKAPPRR